ncbi:ABC transporter substrate binding protein [Kocuria rhizophila]|nr:ABC transporter substrate binding protein [Kocuria rhizophila]
MIRDGRKPPHERLLPVAAAATPRPPCRSPAAAPAAQQSGDGRRRRGYRGHLPVRGAPRHAAREGFVEALKDGGYRGREPHPGRAERLGDEATARRHRLQLRAPGDDLYLGIATPSAQSLAQAVTDKPVPSPPCTDPVDAPASWTSRRPRAATSTGTTDMNPGGPDQAGQQAQLAAKSVGIIYSSGETNSQIQVTRPRRPPRPRVSRSWRRPSPPRLRSRPAES